MSKSIDLDWVKRLAEKNPREAVKCLVYYIELREEKEEERIKGISKDIE